jgi:flagellar export protein FliJ
MNSPVIDRACWSVLVKKTEDKIAALQLEISQARKRIESLEGSQSRIQSMYDDYRNRLNDSQTESQGMREAMNQRQFMAQLLTLLQRVNLDIQHTQNLLASQRERMLELERERIKMQTLANQNAIAVQKDKNRKEQKQMDSLAVMQFNMRA